MTASARLKMAPEKILDIPGAAHNVPSLFPGGPIVTGAKLQSRMNLATLLFLADAAPAKAVDTGLQGMQMFVWMAFAFALIYFVSIRPQSLKQKELQKRIASLKTGDKVVTTGGIYGIVANVKDGASTTLTLKIADNVKIEIDKTAIAGVVNPDAGKPAAQPAVAKA